MRPVGFLFPNESGPHNRIVHLGNGFASGPQSSKAQFFRARFEELGVPFEIPQLDEGNFETLTVSGQLAVIDRAVRGEPVTLMGSSLGGYLAALYASRHPNVEKLVLLAPAFQFPSRWRKRYGSGSGRMEADRHQAFLSLWIRNGTPPGLSIRRRRSPI